MSSSNNQAVVLLVEEEEVEALVDPAEANSALCNVSMLVRRPGRFLKPRAASPEDAGGLPLVQPLLREVVSAGLVKGWPPEVLFRGWGSPTAQWNQWVRRLRLRHGGLWVDAGIHDAVVASTCEFPRDDAAMLGLLECWCPETNTFVLPWPSAGGVEATVTLEDVIILGGLPVLGEAVRAAPTGEAGELLGKLVAEHRSLRGQCGLRRVSHAEWMDHHMHARSGPLEHAAFLALWLSRFVFPGSAVRCRVLSIAARLAVGRRIALGPAVLASLYSDLRLMKMRALAEGICDEESPIVVWAPFHILQVWVWERFGSLRPEDTPHFLHVDEPRAARWRCSHARGRDLSIVRATLASPAEFHWRPYVDIVDDWGHPSYYRNVGRWFTVGAGDGDSLPSLLRCLRAGELVGLDCVERYAPHRVAMQFGLDQDVPGRIPYDGTSWELNLLGYDEGTQKVKFYVPSRLCKPRATEQFLRWQKEWMSARMVEVQKIAMEQMDGVCEGQQLKLERKHYSLSTECTRGKRAWKASTSSTSDGEQPECVGEGGTWTNKLSPTYTEKETRDNGDSTPMEEVKSSGDGEAYNGNQLDSSFQKSAEDLIGERCEDANTEEETETNGDCEPMEILKSNRDEEAYSGDQFDSTCQKSTEDLVGEDCEDYDYEQLEQFIIQELEKVEPPKEKYKKKVIDVELERQKDLEFEKEIRQLKAEIAELEAQLMQLKSAEAENEQRLF